MSGPFVYLCRFTLSPPSDEKVVNFLFFPGFREKILETRQKIGYNKP